MRIRYVFLRWQIPFAIAIVAGLSGCFKYTPPSMRPIRSPSVIAAPFDSTWGAVISWFAERNIPIRTIEKASGIVVAEPSQFDIRNREAILDAKGKQRRETSGAGQLMFGPPLYADCGQIAGLPPIDPSSAVFNVRVTGDAKSSTFQVNVRFAGTQFSDPKSAAAQCVSTGRWESEIEAFVRARLHVQ